MKPRLSASVIVPASRRPRGRLGRIGASGSRGSVLIIVMWICLGLVALTLYFANSMSSEMTAANNRVAEVAARQAVAAGTRYAAYVLTQHAVGGVMPSIDDYKSEAVLVGDDPVVRNNAEFWFIGRNYDELPTQLLNEPYYSLVDEASKLNLNTATSAMIQALPLPGMTPEFADAIVAWRTATGTAASEAENYYTQLVPPRHNKGAPYETTDEVRLVNGAMLDILLGEDTNRNGTLEANEDDADASAPRDDQNGELQAGLLEYVTVYSKEPTTSASGANRINITTLNTAQAVQALVTRLTTAGITQQRATQIGARVSAAQVPVQAGRGGGAPATTPTPYASVAEFMLSAQMTAEEYAMVHTEFTAVAAGATGLVNVNTATAAVLGAITGIGPENAPALVAYRQSHPDEMTSFAWLSNVLSAAAIRRAGPYITDQSYQFSADIAAVGPNGRGYRREKVVFDMSTGKPRIVYRQDFTGYGWALGVNVRRNLSDANIN